MQFNDGVNWKLDSPSPFLLTNNLDLYKKFVDNNDRKYELETIINQYGMEHLIPIHHLSIIENEVKI